MPDYGIVVIRANTAERRNCPDENDNKKQEKSMTGHWRDRAATSFQCRKKPASGSRGMVVSNHPLASSAGAEMLAAGGNAIDAAIATLFTLTVVEPMMVGIIGGGMAHIRLADGSHRFIDGQSTVPSAVPRKQGEVMPRTISAHRSRAPQPPSHPMIRLMRSRPGP